MPPAANIAEIMLVDDDPFMLKLLSRLLARQGFRCVTAFDNGPAALRHLCEPGVAIDLIMLDINMPAMDGVEFLRRLAEWRYGGSLVLVSGENTRILEGVEKLLQAHQLLSLGHLHKPISTDALAAVLQKLEPGRGQSIGSGPHARSYGADDLRAAMARGELVNHYQPKVTLRTGEVIGVESLVRWQHPADGLLPPDRFLSVIADHGLMPELTRTVLDSALQQVGAWWRAGHRIPAAINVSMDDLTDLSFPDVAATLAAAAGVDPRMITLEITEGQVMRQLSTALDVISRLRLKRFRLSIDDFGTGHSSLAQLRDLPFDELKVDRGFVHGAAEDHTLLAICTASLRMAQQLQLQVVAEGVEQSDDWVLLRDLGCDVAQGFLISRPLTGEGLMDWIRRWNQRRGEQIPLEA